jgi:ATP-dependent Clp protease ATP-binding subunit ClpC
MFERYTERARRVIFFARYEASQFGNSTIDTEHLVIALGREDKHIVRRFSANSDVDIRRKVAAYVSPGKEKVPTSVDLPLSEACGRILEYARQEAEGLSHQHIGTEHLLLGMLRETDCVAARVLRGLGVELEAVRLQLLQSKAFVDANAAGSLPERLLVHMLVDELPEHKLARAKQMLEQLLSHDGLEFN